MFASTQEIASKDGSTMKHSEIHQIVSSHELSLQNWNFHLFVGFEGSTTSNYSMIYNKNLEGSFKYLSLRSCCQLWIYKYTLNMIVDIYSLQLETSRSTLLKICIVNVKRLLLCVTFQKMKIVLQEVILRVAKNTDKICHLSFNLRQTCWGMEDVDSAHSDFKPSRIAQCAVNIFHAIQWY